MAKTKQQYKINTIMLEDAVFVDRFLTVDLRDVVKYHENVANGRIKKDDENVKHYKSRSTMVSSNRLFEMFSDGTEVHPIKAIMNTEGYAFLPEDAVSEIDTKEINVAPEFIIVDFDFKLSLLDDEKRAEIVYLTPRLEEVLSHGIKIIDEQGVVHLYKRVVRSASQNRSGKAYFTRLDVKMVRTHATYGAFFLTRTGEQNLAKLESRIGLATSSTMKLDTKFSFDVLPDHKVSRKHKRIIVGSKLKNKKRVLNITDVVDTSDDYNYADGQGYVRPRMATKWALEARIINFVEYTEIMIMLDLYDEDLVAIHDLHDEEFNKVWSKVPSAFQVRYGLCKGLLVVFPFHLEEYHQDCNKQTYRDNGLVMEYWEASGDVVPHTQQDADGNDVVVNRHYYDFDVDVMFTDSMWKENFDPAYINHKEDRFRPKMELVLWNGREKTEVFMGYQFWQALGSDVQISKFAKEKLAELKNTIFKDAKQALLFLGTIDNGGYGEEEDAFVDHLLAQNSAIAKVQYTLMHNPSMINDRYVKKTLRKVIRRYIERMRDDARIPVQGANPYIIADPMPCFGLPTVLKKKQNYYNNMACEAGGFRSPLVDESEAVVLQLNRKKAFRGLFRNVLVLNWYDDTLPRMGGADTDGDKIALIFDIEIISYIKTDLPMIVDSGETGQLTVMTQQAIADYDLKTILPEAYGGEKVYGIGECTTFSTIWKDIKMSPNMMALLGKTDAELELKNKKLRGVQGISIDFAKTNVNVPLDKDLIIHMQPAWKKGYVLTDHLRDSKGNIKVYVSESEMQKNWDYVNEVLEDFDNFAEDVSDGSGYTFLKQVNKLDVIDLDETRELTKTISALENAYRQDISRATQFADEDERIAFIVNVIDMYRFAIDLLPFPASTVSAIAYQLCYNTSSSKGNSLSFVWNCCFTGLARLMEATEQSLLLRTLRLPVDVCYAPKFINVYKQEFTFTYKVKKKEHTATSTIAVPNGKYKVVVEGERAFIEMKAGIATERKIEQIERRIAEYAGKTIVSTVTGMKYSDYNSVQFVDALKANNGILQIVDGERTSQDGSVRSALSVQIDGKSYGIIAEKNSGLFLPIIDGAGYFKVLDFENLEGVYQSKQGDMMYHSAMTLGFVFNGNVEEEDMMVALGMNDSYDNARDYEDESGIPYYPELNEQIEEEEEEELSYMKVDYAELLAVAPKKYSIDVSGMYESIVGFDVESRDNKMIVIIYRKKDGVVSGAKSYIIVSGNGQLKYAKGDTAVYNGETIAVGERYTNLVMQIAKFSKSL